MIDKIKELSITAFTKKSVHLKDTDERLQKMFEALSYSRPEIRPSRYWEELNKMNLVQLQEYGYENFKRTIALNYFTWVRILPWDSQIRALIKQLSIKVALKNLWCALTTTKHEFFTILNPLQSVIYNFLTYMLWEFAEKNDKTSLSKVLSEPIEGNPPIIEYKNRKVSQDLANSIIELNTIVEGTKNQSPKTLLELGSGYGRNAFVILNSQYGANTRYIVVDIPPALYIAEKYLSSQFPEKRIFYWREFTSYNAVATEFEQAELLFLLPNQLELLAAKSVDLIINISSLHEMRPDQIAFYLQEFDRLAREGSYCYLKQWKKGQVLFENNMVIQESDYPIPDRWNVVLWRDALIQTKFFEALFFIS